MQFHWKICERYLVYLSLFIYIYIYMYKLSYSLKMIKPSRTTVKLCRMFRERIHKILYELDSVIRHCNYGWPLFPHWPSGCDFRPGGRNLFLFLRASSSYAHCRFERHEISSITLSLCAIRVSFLMERTSTVTMENKRTCAVLHV